MVSSTVCLNAEIIPNIKTPCLKSLIVVSAFLQLSGTKKKCLYCEQYSNSKSKKGVLPAYKVVYPAPISVECKDGLFPAFFSKLIYGQYCNHSAPEWGSKSCPSLALSNGIHQTRG